MLSPRGGWGFFCARKGAPFFLPPSLPPLTKLRKGILSRHLEFFLFPYGRGDALAFDRKDMTSLPFPSFSSFRCAAYEGDLSQELNLPSEVARFPPFFFFLTK